MASNAKNLAELLNTDTTVAVADVADGSITTAKLADDAVTNAKIGAGAVGTTEIADDAVTSGKVNPAGLNLGRRNIIINGAMNVSQRGTSFSYANGTYCLDRFFMGTVNSSGGATVTQDSSSPDGFSNSLKVDVTTADTSVAVNHADQILYRVEAQDLQQLAFGTSSAKNFTLSFYVKSNKTGTYSVNIGQNDNSYKQANLTYTITSANTWERKSLTFTGDTSGVINDDNGHGFEIVWVLAAGTNFTSGSNSASFVTYADANYSANHGVNVFDSTDNTWFLTGVQLEVGDSATDFEHRSFKEELALCQRYYQKVDDLTAGYGSGTNQYARGHYMFPVKMRTAPTSTYTYTAGGGTIGANGTHDDSFYLTFSNASATIAPRFDMVQDAEL